MDTVQITISRDLFKRLQGFAEPLVDTIETVLDKICDNWEHNPPSEVKLDEYKDNFAIWGPSAATDLSAYRLYEEARQSIKAGGLSGNPSDHQLALIRKYLAPFYRQGAVVVSKSTLLPLGLELSADYQAYSFTAKVTKHGIEFRGEVFDNPSSAAVAAKMSTGMAKDAAQTNGWTFWTFGKGTPQGRFPIHLLRQLFPTQSSIIDAQSSPEV